MRVSSIQINNLRGFTELKADLPAVSLIQGGNGEGKSSFIKCVIYPFETRHDDEMISKGQDSGEVILTMDDGTQLRARATRGEGTDRMTKKPGAKKWEVGRKYIDSIANAISYNPLSLIGMKPKELLETVLKVMPIALNDDELIATLAGAPLDAGKIPATIGSLDPLSRIGALRKIVYDERTTLNVAADTHNKHAAELENSLGPKTEEKDWAVEVARLEAELGAARESQEDDMGTIREILNAEIKKFQDVRDREIEQSRKKCEEAIEESRGISNRKWEALEPKHYEKIKGIQDGLSVARERDRLSVSHAATRNAADVAKQHAITAKKKSEQLTAAIAKLDALKVKTAAGLNIPGITIENGIILNEKKVPFSEWNEQAQVFFCLRIAVLGPGSCGIVVIDGKLNELETRNQVAVMEAAQHYAEEKKMQFLFTSVKDEAKLTVEAVPTP